MPIRPITAAGELGLERDSVAVCVPLLDGDGPAAVEALATVSSVIEHTAESTPVLVVGDAAQIESLAHGLGSTLGERSLLGLLCDRDAGDARAVNLAAGACFPADLVVVAPGVRVVAHWLERLRRAATSDSTVASATPFAIGAGALPLFAGEAQYDDGAPGARRRIEQQAQEVHARGMQLFPRIATVGPGCAYLRRTLLELAGPLDEGASLRDALGRLAMQAIAAGMVHVAADDVLVAGMQGAAGETAGATGEDTDESSDGAERAPPLEARVRQTLQRDERASLQRAMAVARTALRPLSLTIDARALTSAFGGTQTYIAELILALAHAHEVKLRVLIAPDISERAAAMLSTLADVDLITYQQVIDGVPLTDVVHRPQPAFTPADLTLLRMVGERVVIGQLDLIAYHNYSYHQDVDHWRAYRRTTRLALAGADHVIFFSEHARRDVLAEDLLPEGRTSVVAVGVDALEPAGSPAAPPDGFSPGDPFLLCLGTDYAHKNRCFAIELLGALRERGWTGRLVLAGGHVPYGSSRERERELLGRRTDLAPFVEDLGTVDEPGKQWLLEHARALLYPTLYEGFGLLPLEAARAGVPCLFAPQASLAEVAGQAATLVAWDAAASAAAVLPLLADGPARAEHVARLRSLAVPTWEQAAQRLLAVYEHALAAPPSEAAPRVSQELEREDYIVSLDRDMRKLKAIAQEYQDAYHALEARVATGLPLIDEGGLLDEAQQRGLMRVAARGSVGSVLLAPFGWLGRRSTTRS
jgi:glycosyltransferase involved in cell wall biosynthesis